MDESHAGGRMPLFGSGGEVGRVMERWDWARTTVGPPEHWAGLLQTMVRILLSSQFPMWMGWGPDLTFFYNDAYRRDTLRVKHPWALGRPASEVWAEIWPDISPRIDSVIRTGAATWDEALLLFLERSGYREETYHTFSYSPISEADGTIVGMLCVVTEDTTRVIGDRRMATLRHLASELARTRTEDEVFAAVEARLGDNLLDLPFTLTYVYDAAGGLNLVSASGITPGGRAAPLTVAPADLGGWPLAAARDGNRSVVVDGLASHFGSLPSGRWEDPPERAIVVPLAGQSPGEHAGFLVAALNPYRPVDLANTGFVELLAGQIAASIASARAYEAERRRAEALAALDRAKTEFFSNVSHEFRTPLTLILGPAEDSLSDILEPLAPAQAARLEVIRRNARRLRRLVNDMLDFARIEGGRLRAETVATDLAEVTRDIAASFGPAVERAGLRFEIDCPTLPRPVHVDADMWEKVVLNLLSNALKFTLDGQLEVTLRGEAEAARLTVRDTGVGIAADQLPLLFQRFYRAPRTAARSHEGTGIGLALVNELVRLHDGTIVASSREGLGSTFTVTIPYGDAATGSPSTPRDSSRQAYLDEALQWTGATADADALGTLRSLVGRSGDATVLVVDDNPDMRAYVARVLEPFWKVQLAADGALALELARVARPQLVLTDVMMPGLDGFGLLRALREDPRTATIPVVFLSARAGEEASVEGLDAGADDYLVKPFSAVELLARVRSNLELAALRNEEAQWRTALVHSLAEAVIVMDESGTVLEANPAFERILGFDWRATPYKRPYPWAPDPEADPTEFHHQEERFGQLLEGGRLSGIARMRHRDGHPVYTDSQVSPVGDGDARRFISAFRDVTMELATAEREAALARLGIQLAEASDVDAVRQVGLDELKNVFGAQDATFIGARIPPRLGEVAASAPDPTEPGTRWNDVRRALARADPGGVGVLAADGSERADTDAFCVGVGARIAPGAADAVWLEFSPPRRFNATDRSLLGVLCGYFGQALRRAQLFDDSRAVATAMQRSILGPIELPPNIAVRYVPAVQPLEVGGDWYDVIDLPQGRIGLVVGDCVGNGLQAATVMGQLRSACRALMLGAAGPADVIAALNAFAWRIPGARCTTVFCGIIDPERNTLRYTRAGHVPGLLVSSDSAVRLLGNGSSLPLAVLLDAAQAEEEVVMPAGSTLVLCTDGLVERRGETLDTGLGRPAAAVTSARHLAEDPIADRLVNDVRPPDGQRDDIALIVYRHPVDPEEPFSAQLPADPRHLAPLRHALRAWLERAGVDGDIAAAIVLAAGEACSNAMEHAYGFSGSDTVRVSLRRLEGVIEMTVADGGSWKQPAVSAPDTRGRGMAIMRGVMDAVVIEVTPEGTTVRLVKEVDHAR